jgi:hypothetical protein
MARASMSYPRVCAGVVARLTIDEGCAGIAVIWSGQEEEDTGVAIDSSSNGPD